MGRGSTGPAMGPRTGGSFTGRTVISTVTVPETSTPSLARYVNVSVPLQSTSGA
jgi:hypothetical protein